MVTQQQTSEDNVVVLEGRQPGELLRSKTLMQRALYRLRHDYLTLAAIGGVLLLAILSFSAPIFVEVLNVNYNNNDLYLNKLPPGSSASESNTTVQQWNLETGESRRAFVGHIQPVTHLEYHPDDVFFLTVGDDNSVRIWNVNTGGTKRALEFLDEGLSYTAATFQPTGVNVAVGISDGTVEIWEREKANYNDEDVPLLTIDAHDGAVSEVEYGTDGVTLLSGAEDGLARLWDAETGTLLSTFEVGSPVRAVALFSEENMIATGAENGELTLWDSVSGDSLWTSNTGAPLNSVYFNSDGSEVLTSGGQRAKIWDAATGELVSEFEYSSQVNSARYIQEDSAILAAAENGSALIWDRESGEITEEFDEFTFPMQDAIIAPDGATMLTASDGQRRTFYLGTDSSGRDQLTRMMRGGQVSLKIGFFSAVGTLTIGVLVGVTAGYFGGAVDDFVMWIITTLDSIPFLYLLLIVSALVANNPDLPISNTTALILVLVMLVWTGSTRIVRGETFSIRERDYVLAARALGASNARIMFRHIAPNVISILLIVLTRLIANLILAESALSFLGFGVKPPTPTWGNMLSNDLGLLRDAPHLVFGPGLLITVTVLCLFVIGDGLRDAFDPTLAD